MNSDDTAETRKKLFDTSHPVKLPPPLPTPTQLLFLPFFLILQYPPARTKYPYNVSRHCFFLHLVVERRTVHSLLSFSTSPSLSYLLSPSFFFAGLGVDPNPTLLFLPSSPLPLPITGARSLPLLSFFSCYLCDRSMLLSFLFFLFLFFLDLSSATI